MSFFVFKDFWGCKVQLLKNCARQGIRLGVRGLLLPGRNNIGDGLGCQSRTEVRRLFRLEIFPKFSDRPTFRHPTAGR